jgi:hypothetical protein
MLSERRETCRCHPTPAIVDQTRMNGDHWQVSRVQHPTTASSSFFFFFFLLFLRSKRATLLGQTAIINCAWPQRLRTGERGNAKPSIRGHHTQQRPLAQWRCLRAEPDEGWAVSLWLSFPVSVWVPRHGRKQPRPHARYARPAAEEMRVFAP